MGMYDNIICSAPLPGTPPAFIKPGHQFQSKDLGCTLATYEITADGRLMYVCSGWSEEEKAEAVHQADFHGDLHFYTSNWAAMDKDAIYTQAGEPYESVDYLARFSNGVLQSIVETDRETKPAKPVATMPRAKAPSPDEIAARKARLAEKFTGRTMFVLMGGRTIEKGYSVEVIAEDENQMVVKSAENGFEVLHRALAIDNTLFDDAAKAKASREKDQTL